MAETIEYCLRNVDDGTRERLMAGTCARDWPDAPDPTETEVVERRCLQRCGTCYAAEFLVVDGTLTTGDSHAALLAEHLSGEADG